MCAVIEWSRMQFLTPKTCVPLLPACAPVGLKETLSAVVSSAFWPLSDFTELSGFASCCVARWPWACRVLYPDLPRGWEEAVLSRGGERCQ